MATSHFKSVVVATTLAVASVVSARIAGVVRSAEKEFAQQALDFIIVGGGTAGLVVAARLAEDSNVQVGVIEAGVYHYDDALVDIPINAGTYRGNPDYDWSFVSTPQAASNGRQIDAARGKMLGGSSGLNSMTWNRASSADYDAWSMFADSGWGWDGFLPYIKKCQAIVPDQNNPFAGISNVTDSNGNLTDFEGFDGPIDASLNTWYSDIIDPYVETLNAAGISTNLEPDDGKTQGIINSRSAVDQALGIRSYAPTGYYLPNENRTNLHVLTGAQVTKIHMAQNGTDAWTATGVTYQTSSGTYSVNATKEVILSAGSVQTPQLLELSGIGNPTILNNLGINVVIDLPQVGENLQEHPFIPVQYELTPGHHTFDELNWNATFAVEANATYTANKTGILAATDSALTFTSFSAFLNDSAFSSLEGLFESSVNGSNLSPNMSALFAIQAEAQRSWLQTADIPQVELLLFTKGLFSPQNGSSYITILVGLMHPLSRGSVHINSTDPTASPLIDLNWLNNDFDVNGLLNALKFALDLSQVSPLKDNIQNRTNPDISVESDSDLLDYIKETSSPGYHLSCTTPMAPQDQGGVVSGDLLVYGTTNLRIADAGIMPLLIGSHLQETVYAIGEKAADLVKSTWNISSLDT